MSAKEEYILVISDSTYLLSFAIAVKPMPAKTAETEVVVLNTAPG